MIKLIASDLDGTLLPEGTPDIDPNIYEVIRSLQDAGVTFVAASGRNYESVMSIFGSMEKELMVISDNGGYLAKGGEEMHCYSFPRDLLEEVVTMARNVPDVWIMASAARGTYTDMDDPEYVRWIREGYQMDIRVVDDLLGIEEPLIKVALYTCAKDAAEVAEPLRQQIGDRVSIAVAGDRWVDLMMPGVNKGGALAYIQQTLGITPEETAAFGDNGNDIPMLCRASESYAVENAREEVKAAAKYVLGDVSQGAVLQQLEKILDMQKDGARIRK
ncbi:MAG: Cof-type HAD-IIB family hydrolase [Lachnospiraceae bacterium]|nr:Cof-type HAD-IIB family hydrolase [Lachnospiraceae bacterium]MDD7176974.1 HAD family hydrolase [bacterium]MDY5516176.1 HAD family hydrolase [Lachnospiraceae bacterium]